MGTRQRDRAPAAFSLVPDSSRFRLPCRLKGNMRARLVLLVLAATSVLPGSATLAGQTPSVRRDLERFRDSLAASDAVESVAQLEADLITRARANPDDAALHLRLGFVALRLGQLTSDAVARRHYDEAASEFEWATQMQPRWPYGWYGLGLAELGVGDAEVTLVQGIQTMLGKDALTRSADAFARSAEVDPGFVLGLVELSNTALRQRVNVRMDVALAALRRAARTTSVHAPALLLARARVERIAGSLDSSEVALEQLLALDRTNPVARYELARTRLLQGDSLAAADWYEAVATGDSAVTDLARRDMLVVMPDSTLLAFDQATPRARAELLREFWNARDADALHPPGARLAEHFRRLDYARRAYRLVSERRQFDIAERFRSGQTEYDDRGVMYIRHGEPDARAQYAAPGIEPNESWLYRRDDGDMLLHFVARQDVQDFRLVESLLDVLPFASTVALRDLMSLREEAPGDPGSAMVEELLRSRQALSPIYVRMLGAGRGGNAQLMTDERAAGRQAIARAASTDSWPLSFGSELAAVVRVMALGTDSAGGHVQVGFAVPVSEVPPRSVPGGLAYPIRTRASVLDRAGRVVARFDTTRGFVLTDGSIPGTMVLGHESIRVPAGSLTVRVVLETESGGMTTPRDTLDVAATTGPSLGLSDIAMGVRSIPLRWSPTARDTAWFNPVGTYGRDEPAEVYVEVTGLPTGTPYRIRMRVLKSGGGLFRKLFGGGTALTLAFPMVHPGGVDRISRVLSLAELSTGDYQLEIQVETDQGERVTRSRPFTVDR